MEKDVLGFKLACKSYFLSLDLNSLRIYGRGLQLKNPTTMKKRDLIEELLKVLCGEVIPQRNKNKGAPIKNNYLDKQILETVARLQKEYLQVEGEAPYGENEENPTQVRLENAPVITETIEESRSEPLQFVVRFSCLNEEQKELFMAFLKSL